MTQHVNFPLTNCCYGYQCVCMFLPNTFFFVWSQSSQFYCKKIKIVPQWNDHLQYFLSFFFYYFFVTEELLKKNKNQYKITRDMSLCLSSWSEQDSILWKSDHRRMHSCRITGASCGRCIPTDKDLITTGVCQRPDNEGGFRTIKTCPVLAFGWLEWSEFTLD